MLYLISLFFLLFSTLNADFNGFKYPIVSITFDDNWSDAYKNAVPILEKYGVSATFYVYTGGLNNSTYMTDQDIIKLHELGHEIAAHSLTHPFLTSLSPAAIEYELSESKKILEKLINDKVNNFSVPYGNVSSDVVQSIKKYYRSNRLVDKGVNDKNFNVYMIGAEDVSETPLSILENKLDVTKEHNLWLVLVFHKIGNAEIEESNTPEELENLLKAIKKRNLKVLTVEQALNALNR